MPVPKNERLRQTWLPGNGDLFSNTQRELRVVDWAVDAGIKQGAGSSISDGKNSASSITEALV